MKWPNKEHEYAEWVRTLQTGDKVVTKHFALLPKKVGAVVVWLGHYYTHYTYYRGSSGTGWWNTTYSEDK